MEHRILIPNEFGTVFELGVQRLETLEFNKKYNVHRQRF